MDQPTWDLIVSSFLPLLGGAVTGTIPLALISFAAGLVLAPFIRIPRRA